MLVHHDVSGREHLLDRLLGLGAGVLLLLELCVLLDQALQVLELVLDCLLPCESL